MNLASRSGFVFALFLLAGCGPSWAPPNAPTTPCQIIDEAAYNAAREGGAAHATARVYANGTVNMTNGPGIRHCATFTSAMLPCRRPNDFVIAYTTDTERFYVFVPANAEYRFNVHAAPNTCQIVRQP